MSYRGESRAVTNEKWVTTGGIKLTSVVLIDDECQVIRFPVCCQASSRVANMVNGEVYLILRYGVNTITQLPNQNTWIMTEFEIFVTPAFLV